MVLIILILSSFFFSWLAYKMFARRTERLIDRYVIGLFICLLPINCVLWTVLVMHEPLNIEDWAGAALSFLIIVICPVATNVLLRYRFLSNDQNKSRKITWLTSLVIAVTILISYFGSQGAFTPTAFAVKKYPTLAKILINASVGINSRNSWWTTPLGIAVETDDIHTAKLLIEKGANVNVTYRYNNGKPVKVFRPKEGGVVEEEVSDDTLIMFASRKGNVEMIKLLIESGADINARTSKGKTALMEAAYGDKADAVDTLIVMGADINIRDDENRTALIYAARRGTLETIQVLLGKGIIFTNEDKNRAFIEAVHWYSDVLKNEKLNSINKIKFFLESGANVNGQDETGSTALMYAAERCLIDFSQMFIDQGASISTADNKGKTVLMRAIGGYNSDIVKMILAKGVDVNTRDNEGLTALMWAVSRNLINEQNIILLLDAGSDINTRDSQGRTPLMWAATSGSRKPMNILLDKGTRINVQDNTGKTPLMYSAGGVPPDVVLKLLEMGADPKLRDSSGRSALDYAVEYDKRSNWPDHKKTAVYLREYGGAE
jgi:ankyrin repeat protein